MTGVNYTFGFVESQVNSSGIVVAPNAGGVDFSLTVDPGTGVSGGSSSNRWLFTPFVTGFGSAVTLPIGLTFYTPGNSGNYALDNNSPGVGNSDRTYSANMTATATPVPEPSTMILIALGLVGVASVRRRHREG